MDYQELSHQQSKLMEAVWIRIVTIAVTAVLSANLVDRIRGHLLNLFSADFIRSKIQQHTDNLLSSILSRYMKKPIDSQMHGIIDYAFAGIQLFGPSILGLNTQFAKTYKVLGVSFTAINATTDTPVGISKAISMKTHQKADAAFLATLSALTIYKIVRSDKKALAFHLAFLGIALVNYALTNYNERR
jgi:hypothetical protein